MIEFTLIFSAFRTYAPEELRIDSKNNEINWALSFSQTAFLPLKKAIAEFLP